MNFLRRLQDVLNPPTYIRAGDVEPTPSTVPAEPDAVPAPTVDQGDLFAVMAYLDANPGVLDAREPALANLLGH